ncbi:MAG: replicative DNA helicase [Colwellia sp.]|jgi:replicative DNA helicase|uniref:Replicative DNA helicase n=1 Tax=Colwellia hornerae TaxID=89402 RepID=A0A5C6QF90_9GAMM|nr:MULTISPECIES: replicative DNA helicase [Colwellia]MBA6362284.1 replicative DNA helicase [Colwellia sp. BRX8-8]AOW76923.1 replicative DNA helicase [Colwellia sp. PAMC 20917]MBA6254239.1 replicative DNA helicase [Colwellia sp. MB3u-55]MBA6337919.1 replicative DNA helicase [Colwellia sp. BRX8-7]MBA6346846.1 replicative DNA helicase [Colwellia sp. BRX8-9]|tara:strand:- start:788 stop:2206 length:1419 start_codon:yes stop_codon:yes gene_type:complete
MAERKPNKFFKDKKYSQDSQMNALKVPPHSLEAEQSVLGGLLLDNETWDRVGERVVAQDFYSRSHRITFETIAALIELGNPVDLITLSEALENEQRLEDAGGFAYLAEMMRNTPSAANITAYADIVRERAVTREMISVANEIAEAGYDPQGRASAELLDFAETKIFAIAEQRANKSEGPENITSVLEKTVDRIEQLCSSPNNGVTGVSSGFSDLDKMTAGFQKSDLIIVAARPSMGKTTFAMNIAENAAMTEDKPALIFSLEMPAEQLMMRMLASLGRIDQTKIRTGQLGDEDWARLSSTMGLLIDKGKMFIDDAAGLTPTDVRSRARRIARDHGGISMIMIDYLQLMRAPQFADNRTLEIAEISRSLKALAKELQVPVVALSQLNRSLEQRSDKRPINSDLRESGSIEQDADLIMFIYRDEVYHDDSEFKGMAEIIIGKQRNGPIGRVPLTFQGQFSRFDNYAGPHVLDED